MPKTVITSVKKSKWANKNKICLFLLWKFNVFAAARQKIINN